MSKKDEKPVKAPTRSTQPSDRVVAEAAWLYFVRGKTQGEVAKQLSVSRPTIINYLRIAKERKLVNIRLDARHYRMNEASEKLKDTFGLKSVFVVSEAQDSTTAIKHQVCEVAAHFLPNWLQAGDALGVSWGDTISQVAELIPGWPIENLIVTQLIGSLAEPFPDSSESCCKNIARQLSGYCIHLNAPVTCSTAELATALMQEPAIRQQLQKQSECNKAIFSLSPCAVNAREVHRNIALPEDIHEYKNKGAVGIINGRFINAAGQAVTGELDSRLICVDHSLLRSVESFLVVSGTANQKVTLAALRGGYADHLALDVSLAEAVLEATGQLRTTSAEYC
ncbi:hypothetical protein AB833_02245 [Chromatiales bacterium (ex Bugula neritina AB1)]|nr:hypothetical protein AB833_02245 [Chromatiales bacterium (ex Bugula neritina AB1)]